MRNQWDYIQQIELANRTQQILALGICRGAKEVIKRTVYNKKKSEGRAMEENN